MMTSIAPPAALPIHVQHLNKKFESKHVLRGVDLEISPGQVVGLLGKNGSGKTTLIKCVLGLLRPSHGTVNVHGDEAWNLTAATKTRIGYVPQETASYPWMRVRHVLAYTAAFYPRWNDRIARRRQRGTASCRFLQRYGFAPWPTWLICGQTVVLIALIPLVFFMAHIDHSNRRIALIPWSFTTQVALIITVAGPQLFVVTMLSARRPRLISGPTAALKPRCFASRRRPSVPRTVKPARRAVARPANSSISTISTCSSSANAIALASPRSSWHCSSRTRVRFRGAHLEIGPSRYLQGLKSSGREPQFGFHCRRQVRQVEKFLEPLEVSQMLKGTQWGGITDDDRHDRARRRPRPSISCAQYCWSTWISGSPRCNNAVSVGHEQLYLPC